MQFRYVVFAIDGPKFSYLVIGTLYIDRYIDISGVRKRSIRRTILKNTPQIEEQKNTDSIFIKNLSVDVKNGTFCSPLRGQIEDNFKISNEKIRVDKRLRKGRFQTKIFVLACDDF